MLIDAAAADDDDPNDSYNAAGCFLLTFDNVNAQQQQKADTVATTKINIMKTTQEHRGTPNFLS